LDYVEEICTAKYRVPYVCNGCETIGKCTLLKNIYDAEHAHIKAHEMISESRSGLCISEEEIARLNSIISPLVRNGQSIHQIYVTHEDELMCSEKTIYNYIDACLLEVRNIDLPRKVKFRERYKKPEFKVDKGCRIGRNYQEFNTFLDKNPDTAVVQMDSVIGSKGGKCLLTIHFVDSSFMLAYLRDANTSKSVIDIFEMLFDRLGFEVFKRLFPIILTDNGSEFSNPKAIEYGTRNQIGLRTKVFYCDAGSPYQKGAIEVNHELIRRVLPKGTGFNELTQRDINLMMNHINSYKRKKLNNRSPYETFSFYHGEEVLQKLECSPVEASDIVLKPTLLKK
jgi:IS30 family transposase